MTQSASSLIAKRYDCPPYSDTLLTHSLRVAEEAKREAILCFDEGNPHAPLLIELAWLCAFFHDIGKCDKDFQDFINKDDKSVEITSENGPISRFHNIIGAILFNNYVSVYSPQGLYLNKGNLANIVTRSIFHHHAPYLSDIYTIKYRKEYSDVMREMVKIAQENLSIIEVTFTDPEQLSYSELEELELTGDDVKYYTNQRNGFENVYNFMLDQIVKMSDVIISKPTSEPIRCFDKIHYRSNNVTTANVVRPPHYDSRYEVQCDEAMMLSQKKMSVFVAQPGFGKTGTGLHYILSNSMEKRKAFWVCPRNSIAEAVYNTLVNEIDNRRLSDKVNVALLLTNDWKHGNADADIIVTNIDNFLRPILKNDAIHRTFNMLNAVCVFDEFHEYVGMNTPLMATFDIVLKARGIANCHTLLLSATPIMNFPALKELQNEDRNAIHQYNDPLLDERIYNILYGEVKDLPERPQDTLIQFNSRSAVQRYYDKIQQYRSHLIHSHYLDSDRERIFDELLSLHGKNGKNPDEYNCIATNIISTGVDVSFRNLTINLPSPDGLIQSLGRCNRWNDGKGHTLTVTNSLRFEGEKQAIRVIFGRTDIHTTFYQFLKKNLPAGPHTFREIRKIRDKFYKEYKELYKDYFTTALESSYRRLPNLAYEFSCKSDEILDEVFVGNNVLRSSDDTSSFWCQLYYANGKPCEELYQGDTLGLGIDTEGKDRKRAETLVDFHDKKIKRKSFQKKEASVALKIYLNHARSNKYPLHISPDVCYYDKKYGVVKRRRKD